MAWHAMAVETFHSSTGGARLEYIRSVGRSEGHHARFAPVGEPPPPAEVVSKEISSCLDKGEAACRI